MTLAEMRERVALAHEQRAQRLAAWEQANASRVWELPMQASAVARVAYACPSCGPRVGGGSPRLASARWNFAYKSGNARSATLCASCGFKALAHAAILTATLSAATRDVSERRAARRQPVELREITQSILRVRLALAKFQRQR